MEESVKKCFKLYEECPKLTNKELEELLKNKDIATKDLYVKGFIAHEYPIIYKKYTLNKSCFSDLYTFEDFFYESIYTIIEMYNSYNYIEGKNNLAINIRLFRFRLKQILEQIQEENNRLNEVVVSKSRYDLIYEEFSNDLNEKIDKEILVQNIEKIVNSFDDRSKNILNSYLGINNTPIKNATEIAKEMGVNVSWVCVLKDRGIRKIKTRLASGRAIIHEIDELFNEIFGVYADYSHIDRDELSSIIINIVNSLDEHRKKVIYSYYGLNNTQKKSAEEIASEMGLSYSYIMQLKRSAIRKIQIVVKHLNTRNKEMTDELKGYTRIRI